MEGYSWSSKFITGVEGYSWVLKVIAGRGRLWEVIDGELEVYHVNLLLPLY